MSLLEFLNHQLFSLWQQAFRVSRHLATPVDGVGGNY